MTMCNELVTAEKMLGAFEQLIWDKCVVMCGIKICNADSLLYVLKLWKGNLAME